MTQHLLCRVAWSMAGVRAFQREVNNLLKEGYVVRDVVVHPGWVRTACIAILEDPGTHSAGQEYQAA